MGYGADSGSVHIGCTACTVLLLEKHLASHCLSIMRLYELSERNKPWRIVRFGQFQGAELAFYG